MRLAVLLSVLPALISGAAAAQGLDATDPDRLLGLLRAENSSAELTTDDLGDPKFTAEYEGVNYSVFFYGCSGGRYCRTLQFQLGLDLESGLDPASANAWNRDRRYASIFLDEENDPFLQMDLILEYGVAEETFNEAVRLWEGSITDFLDHVDW